MVGWRHKFLLAAGVLSLAGPLGATAPASAAVGPVTCTAEPAVQVNPQQGAAATRPALATDPANPVSAMWTVIGGTDGHIYLSRRFGANPESGWFPFDAPPIGIDGAPAAAYRPLFDRLDVFVRGNDDRLWQRSMSNGFGGTTPWFKPVGDNGTLASNPASASWPNEGGTEAVDVVVVGTDGNVWEMKYLGNTGWRPDWQSLGRPAGVTITGDPALLYANGQLSLFVRGSDDKLWQRFRQADGTWTAWFQPLGTSGVLTSAPGAGAWFADFTFQQATVAVRGTDAGVWMTRWTGATWTAWARQGTPSNVIVDAPAVAGSDGNLEIAALGTDAQIWNYTTRCVQPQF